MRRAEIRIMVSINFRRFPGGLIEKTHLGIVANGPGWTLENLRGKVWAEVLALCKSLHYIADSWRIIRISYGPIDLLSTPPGGPLGDLGGPEQPPEDPEETPGLPA